MPSRASSPSLRVLLSSIFGNCRPSGNMADTASVSELISCTIVLLLGTHSNWPPKWRPPGGLFPRALFRWALYLSSRCAKARYELVTWNLCSHYVACYPVSPSAAGAHTQSCSGPLPVSAVTLTLCWVNKSMFIDVLILKPSLRHIGESTNSSVVPLCVVE